MKWADTRTMSKQPLLRPDSAPNRLGAIKKGKP